jgi:beta-xylosidase
VGSGYRRTPVDIHKGYLDMPSTPLFAFGHGLSYTTFDYSPPKLTSDTVDVRGEARVSTQGFPANSSWSQDRWR